MPSRPKDTYLRLDQDLGLFFEFLDEKIGRDHYTVFLTADHAAAHNVGFLQSHRIPSDSWLYQKVLHRLDSTLNNRFAVQGLVYSLDNYQVHLDRQLISRSRLAYETVKSAVLDYLNNLEGIAYAVDMEKVAISTLPTGIREKIINGYCRERSGAIQIIVKPGWYESGTPTPQELLTGHGILMTLMFPCFSWVGESGKEQPAPCRADRHSPDYSSIIAHTSP